MVIQTRIHDGVGTKTRTYRGLRRQDLSRFIQGFYAQKVYSKWGLMTELRGLSRIRLASFGAIETRPRHIEVKQEPSTFVGHCERVADTFDGCFDDEGYTCYDYSYYEIEWRAI